MKVGVVHILPIEYYPPATNALDVMASRGLDVRVWTSPNQRSQSSWESPTVDVVRHRYSRVGKSAFKRMSTYTGWHFATAKELAQWRPDVVLSIEPHSAIASWIYFNVLRKSSRLFIHHHEYYAPADFVAQGMRLVRVASNLERIDLFKRAEWISQTNVQRLELLVGDVWIEPNKRHVLPNYPPRDWIERSRRRDSDRRDSKVRRLIYLGSASLEDTFIREVAQWVAQRPDELSLSVVGNNVSADVWALLDGLHAPNISTDKHGWPYDELPERLSAFDVGLILYKGNTKNFVYNVPNKAIEYLAAGLDVWYPPQMESMRIFHSQNAEFPLVEVDFQGSLQNVPTTLESIPLESAPLKSMLSLSAETALAPLIEQIERGPAY